MPKPGEILINVDGERKTVAAMLAEISPSAGQARLEFDEAQERQLIAALEQLSEHRFNGADAGELRAMIGDRHFPLRRTLYNTVIYTMAISGGVLAATVNPVAGCLSLGAAVLSALQKATELVTRLTPGELVIYRALAAVLAEKQRAGVKVGATVDEVQTELDKASGETPDLVRSCRTWTRARWSRAYRRSGICNKLPRTAWTT